MYSFLEEKPYCFLFVFVQLQLIIKTETEKIQNLVDFEVTQLTVSILYTATNFVQFCIKKIKYREHTFMCVLRKYVIVKYDWFI